MCSSAPVDCLVSEIPMTKEIYTVASDSELFERGLPHGELLYNTYSG